MASPSLFPLPIEALGPLKTYLVDQLAPISDADSSLLSDYTVALLKAAEASDAEVEAEVKTQLRDFLDHNTDAFVQALFDALRSKSYMPASESLTRKRSRSPSAARSPPKAARLRSPPLGPRSQAPLAHPLPVPPMGSGGPLAGPSSAPSASGPSDRRGPKPCYEYHQRGFCHKGPACTFDHNPAYQGYIPPPPEVAQQLAMAGMGDRVDYGSIWQGRGPVQFGSMGMGGFPMGMGGPPFGGPGFGGPPNGGRSGGPQGNGNGGPSFSGQQMPPQGWQQQQQGSAGFRPPPGMSNGPPMMTGGAGLGAPRSQSSTRGNPRSFPTDASTLPPKNRNGNTLVIMQIPPASLAVPAVTDYFTKFGTVTSVALDVPSSRALVSFASNDEAYKAWKSEEAVLGSRFVKVLWHRPMEGQGVKGIEALERGKAALAADGNKDATMADDSSSAAPVLSKAEMLAKQRLLESQIAQQKVLMARLSGPNLPAEEKAKLMAQFSKLSDEMKAGTGSLSLARPSTTTATNAAGNRMATFSQPAESKPAATENGSMDGVEGAVAESVPELSQTEMLQRKLEVLKAEAALIGVDPNAPSSPGPSTPYSPAPRGRGRGRGRGAVRGAFRGGYNASYSPAPSNAHKSMTLDFRTKSIAVAGDGLTDNNEAVGAVERWYEAIGGVDSSKVETSANRIIVTFKSRPLAEKALARGSNITDLSIPTSISWYNAPPSMTADAPAPAAAALAAPAEEERRDWDADEEEDGQRRR